MEKVRTIITTDMECDDVNLTITKMTNKILPVLWLFFCFLIGEDQIFRTVRWTNHLNDFWMVKQSIQDRICNHWILKQLAPFRQILVTCNDCWFLLISSWYELKKQTEMICDVMSIWQFIPYKAKIFFNDIDWHVVKR